MARYVVELERPTDGWGRLQAATASARDVAAAMRRDGVPVRFLRLVFVPEDEACFFLYEATSREVAEEAAERSATAVASVQEVARPGGERGAQARAGLRQGSGARAGRASSQQPATR